MRQSNTSAQYAAGTVASATNVLIAKSNIKLYQNCYAKSKISVAILFFILYNNIIIVIGGEKDVKI